MHIDACDDAPSSRSGKGGESAMSGASQSFQRVAFQRVAFQMQVA